jgi:hypothetical protein
MNSKVLFSRNLWVIYLAILGCHPQEAPGMVPRKATIVNGEVDHGTAVDFEGESFNYTVSIHPRDAHSYGAIAVDFFEKDGTFWQREVLLRDGALFSPMEIIGEHAGLVLFTKSVGSGGYGKLEYLEYGENSIYPATPISGPTANQIENTMGRDWAWLENNRLFRRWPIYRDTDSNCCPSGGEIVFEYLWDEDRWKLTDKRSNSGPQREVKR